VDQDEEYKVFGIQKTTHKKVLIACFAKSRWQWSLKLCSYLEDSCKFESVSVEVGHKGEKS
jgi:hypothetical protein